jgi:hypothetical protein
MCPASQVPVRVGHHPVLAALPDGHWHLARLLDREAPVGDEREVIVAPAGDPGAQRGVERRSQVVRELRGDLAPVHRRDQDAQRARYLLASDLAGTRCSFDMRTSLVRPDQGSLAAFRLSSWPELVLVTSSVLPSGTIANWRGVAPLGT